MPKDWLWFLFTVELMPTRGRAVARADFRDLHVLLQAIGR